jgi:hypothetical protein
MTSCSRTSNVVTCLVSNSYSMGTVLVHEVAPNGNTTFNGAFTIASASDLHPAI